jgi:hypothetical protein
MRRRFMTGFGAAVLGVLLLSSLAPAQSKKKDEQPVRSVQGVVSDEAGTPVPGAIVQLKNTKSLQVRSFITKEHGEYFFHGLSSDVDYQIRAELQSNGTASGTRTLSSFDSRKQAFINLKLDKK